MIDKFQYIYRNIYITDSVIKVDSIPYAVPVEVEKVVYKKTLLDNIQLWALYIVILLLVLWCVWNWIKNKIIPFM